MNQRSKRGSQANGNSADEVRRGATRPATVVAIVLCVGFAIAMVAIWPSHKPRSHQEMQTQPKAAVQIETPKPEAVSDISLPDDAKPLELSTATPVSRATPAAPSNAVPISQASAAAGQVTDNSPTPAEDDQTYDFSHDLYAETVTFEGVNPTTKVPGQMTVAVTGRFRGNRLSDGESSAGSNLNADQEATFSFVPYDRYSPSYSATVKRLRVVGDTTNDSILFEFALTAYASDGSSQRFTLREIATITEDSAQVRFEQVK